MTLSTDQLTNRGITAARAGNRAAARSLFEQALQYDESNVVAWWWLARMIDDPKARRAYLEKTRSAASQTERTLAVYRSLLQDARVPSLPIFVVAQNSRSLGHMCPGCSENLKVGATIVICSSCGAAHHTDCWEGLAYDCGNYECDFDALVDHSTPLKVEPAVSQRAVVIEEQDVPAQPVGPTRQQQEAGFINRLRNQMAATTAAAYFRRRIEEEIVVEAIRQEMQREMAREVLAQMFEERARRAREETERRQQELARRMLAAFLIGLLPGLLIAIGAYSYSQSWWLAIFMTYVTAWSIATVTGQAYIEGGSGVSLIYGFLPGAAATYTLFYSYGRWASGLLSVVLAAIIGLFIVNRILRIPALYARRWLISYAVLALAGLFIFRYFRS